MIKDRTARLISSLPAAVSSRKTHEKRGRRNLEAGKTKASFWLETPVHRRLLELCLELNTSQQQIFMEALDLWLHKRGEPSITDLGRGKKQ